MYKVMTIVGTRPEIIKMSRIINEFDLHCDHILVHTGQNYDYELNQIFFDDLCIRKPDYFLNAVGDSAAATIGRVIEKIDSVFVDVQPDAVLVYGDTNSCLAVISAKRRKIPVFHFEAGNRCFDERVPEELNRKVIDHLSDINFVLTEHARRYLIAEGIRQEKIIKSGSHMREVLDFYMPKIIESRVLKKLDLEEGKYFLISAHREENIESPKNMQNLLLTLNELARSYDLPVIVSTHPRTKKRLQETSTQKFNPLIRFLKPFGFFDYVRLQQGALCVISDSGTIAEESSLLNLPAITIRNAHERPEAMDSGAFVMTGLEPTRVLDAVNVILTQNSDNRKICLPIGDYDSACVSQRVLRVVISYIAYVNRTVWQHSSE